MEKTFDLICKECRKSFVATAKWRNYAGHWCRECRCAYMRPRIAAYKKSAKGRAYTRRYKKQRPDIFKAQGVRRRAKRRALYQQMKAAPCADCAVQYPYYVMHFDHVKPG